MCHSLTHSLFGLYWSEKLSHHVRLTMLSFKMLYICYFWRLVWLWSRIWNKFIIGSTLVLDINWSIRVQILFRFKLWILDFAIIDLTTTNGSYFQYLEHTCVLQIVINICINICSQLVVEDVHNNWYTIKINNIANVSYIRHKHFRSVRAM